MGDSFEKMCINWLRKNNFTVVKSCLSRGVFDFIAIPPSYDWRISEHKNDNWDWLYEKVLSIQAKFSGTISKKERINLVNKIRLHGNRTLVVIIYMKDDGNISFKRFS